MRQSMRDIWQPPSVQAAVDRGAAAYTTVVDDGAAPESVWSALGWLSNNGEIGIDEILTRALLAPLRERTGAPVPALAEIAYLRALGDGAAEADIKAVLLGPSSTLIDDLSRALARATRKFAAQGAATPTELHEKFAQDSNSIHLEFGGLTSFFRGLEGVVGPPASNLETGMFREHCKGPDVRVEFVATNYDTVTTSEIEWHFVVNPEDGCALLGLEAKGWPREGKLRQLADAERQRLERQPLPLHALAQQLHKRNEELEGVDSPPLAHEEVVAARLCAHAAARTMRAS